MPYRTPSFAMLTAGRRATRRTWASSCLAVGLLVGSTGCSMFGNVSKSLLHNTTINETMLVFRNHAWSAKSWHSNRDRFCDQPNLDHFEAGYRAGYQSVADGRNGCVPPLPPRKYWNWTYQSPTGKAKANAWFAGFPYGAAAAEQDGLSTWSELSTGVRTPPTVTAQYSTPAEPEKVPHSTATLAPPVAKRRDQLATLSAATAPSGDAPSPPSVQPTGLKRPDYVDLERLIALPVSGLPKQLH